MSALRKVCCLSISIILFSEYVFYPLSWVLQDWQKAATGSQMLLTWGPCGSWCSWRSNLPPPTSAQSAPGPDGTPDPETEPRVWCSAASRRPQWRERTESSLDLRHREEESCKTTASNRKKNVCSRDILREIK